MFEQLDSLGLWLAAVVAGLTALGWLARKAYRGVRKAYKAGREFARRAHAVLEVAEYQLNNNGGGSLLDKIERTERKTDQNTAVLYEVAGTVDKLGTTVDTHLATQAEANRDMWQAIRAVAESRPPNDDE